MKNRMLWALLAAVILTLSACGGSPTASADSWQEQYDLGARYLEEGNYDGYYEEAIYHYNNMVDRPNG